MNNLTEISIVSTAEAAIKKLKKANIGVYNCRKSGAQFLFCVKDKDCQKVFAIFSKPCYNVKVVRQSKKNRALSFLFCRAGLLAGAALFLAAALFSQTFILKIEVSGSGSYLKPEVLRIVYDEGAKQFKPYSSFNGALATGRILALPQVTFCNISKHGSVLIVDVQVDEENYNAVNYKPLVSDVDGVVKNVVAVCGTPAVNAGDYVKKGDTIIYAHTQAGENTVECVAAGYAEIEVSGSVEFFAPDDGEQSQKQAYASILIEEEKILSRKHRTAPADGGVIFVIDFTYLHKLSINLS